MADSSMTDTAKSQIGSGDTAETLSEEVKKKAEEQKEKANEYFKSKMNISFMRSECSVEFTVLESTVMVNSCII